MTIPPITIGRLLAFLVLVAVFVLWLMGHIAPLVALLFAALAFAILLP